VASLIRNLVLDTDTSPLATTTEKAAMATSNSLIPPSISVTLALTPYTRARTRRATTGSDPQPRITLQEKEAVRLSATLVSHASCPITICDYYTILNLYRAQHFERCESDLRCIDIDTNTPVDLQWRVCGRRMSISHKLHDSDSKYFHTLQPGIPYKISERCRVSSIELTPGHKYRLFVDKRQKADWCYASNMELAPGYDHRYFVKDEQEIFWWRVGTKEEVLELPVQDFPEYLIKPSGDPIILTGLEPVEFKVPFDWQNVRPSVNWDIDAMSRATSKGTSTPPSVTAKLALKISNLSGDPTAELFITIVSHASIPVTIWIWPTLLNMGITQGSGEGGALTITHPNRNKSIRTRKMFHVEKHIMIHGEDRYFHTLQPEQPCTFSRRITSSLIKRIGRRPGRYRIAISGSEKVK
jgi:hypothetical protein